MTAPPARDLAVRRLATFTGLRPDLVEGRPIPTADASHENHFP